MLHILNVIQPSITEDRIGNIVRSYHNHQKTLFQFFCVFLMTLCKIFQINNKNVIKKQQQQQPKEKRKC